MNNCKFCTKECNPLGLSSHQRYCKLNPDKQLSPVQLFTLNNGSWNKGCANKNCVQCDKIHKNPKFCSKTCAAVYNNNIRHPENARIKRIVRKTKNRAETRTCKICTKEFVVYRGKHKRITCSPECAIRGSSNNRTITKYPHKDGYIVSLDSSWEVKIAQWLDHKNINWIRPKYIPWIDSNKRNRKYFPDFYLPEYDIYLDPKNDYQVETSKEKLDYITNIVTLLYGRVEEIINQLEGLKQ